MGWRLRGTTHIFTRPNRWPHLPSGTEGAISDVDIVEIIKLSHSRLCLCKKLLVVDGEFDRSPGSPYQTLECPSLSFFPGYHAEGAIYQLHTARFSAWHLGSFIAWRLCGSTWEEGHGKEEHKGELSVAVASICFFCMTSRRSYRALCFVIGTIIVKASAWNCRAIAYSAQWIKSANASATDEYLLPCVGPNRRDVET